MGTGVFFAAAATPVEVASAAGIETKPTIIARAVAIERRALRRLAELDIANPLVEKNGRRHAAGMEWN
jgi:hypothetical protein